MSEHLNSAISLLRLVRDQTDAIGVAVSFGKDSLATLDLCCSIFSRVEGYYLFRVRGLSIVDEWSDDVRRRYGVNVRMYPHFDLSRCYRFGVLRPHLPVSVPRISQKDIETFFRQEVGVDWIAMGWRRNDSMSRSLIMRQTGGYDPVARRVYPLRAWRRQDVYEFLAERGIPAPPTLGRKEQGGLDFHPEALRTLRSHPNDWARWLRDFPFSEIMLADRNVEQTRHPANAARAQRAGGAQ